MQLPHLPLLILDTETTGFVPRTHRVIEYACMRVEQGAIASEYEQLLACEEVPPLVEVLTRIRTQDLQGKPPFEDKRAEIAATIPEDALIVGQNVLFDIGMLKGEGIDLSKRPWIDTSMLASLVFPELRSYSLGYLSRVLSLNHNPPHRALGDVRATMELLSRCWERLLELPPEMLAETKRIMEKSSPGYQMLFAALPPAAHASTPAWMAKRPVDPVPDSTATLAIPSPKQGGVELCEEPLDSTHLHAIIRGALADAQVTHWIAVKNLRVSMRRLPPDLHAMLMDGRLGSLHAPSVLPDAGAVERFLAQDAFTPDEATLALKLTWHGTRRRDELPLHGGEESVWNGKIACTERSPAYAAQFQNLPGAVLLEHRELLRFLESPDHPARALLEGDVHMLVDDASMLEDTATKAFGWYCGIDDLRAASQGDQLLTRFTDVLQLWIEKVRQSQDIRYITESDVKTPEAKGLRGQLEEVLAQGPWPDRTREELECVQKVLDPDNLGGRITWIEMRQNGSQTLQSVPERIGTHLMQTLYGEYPATLLIPQGCSDRLPEVLPTDTNPACVPLAPEAKSQFLASLPISLKTDPQLELILQNPPAGKTIILLPGKSSIESLYVKYTEMLEEKGVTLICQGVGGGQGRMQAEFTAAAAPAVWLLTPWMFEGIELPPGTVDHLILKTLPFDHPAHPVLSKRAARYQDSFKEYSIPRLLHRIFRILRTYARFRTAEGDVRIMDERLFSKAYGKTVREYVSRFSSGSPAEASAPPAHGGITSAPMEKPQKKAALKKPEPPKNEGQMSMF